MNKNDLICDQRLEISERGTGGTYAVGEVSDQVLDGQAPCLHLVIQPKISRQLGFIQRRKKKDKVGEVPFGEGLLLHINPLLLNRQHLRSRRRHSGPIGNDSVGR